MTIAAKPIGISEERARPPRRAVFGRLPSLTGLRFIAALLVFCYHSSLALPALSPFASRGVDGYALTSDGWQRIRDRHSRHRRG